MDFTKFEKLRIIIDEFGASPVIAKLEKILLDIYRIHTAARELAAASD